MDNTQADNGDGLDKDKLAARIRKLFNQANGTDNEAEAKTFRERAFELLAKYGMAETDVQTAGLGGGDAGQIIRIRVKLRSPYRDQRIHLLAGIGYALHSRAVLEGDGVVAIVGVRRHVERIKFLKPLIELQMMNAAGNHVPDDPFDIRGVREDRKGFMRGYADEVAVRIAQTERESAKGTPYEALLTEETARVETAFKKLYPVTGKWTAEHGNSDGYRAGGARARTADIGQNRMAGGRQQLTR
ncbi:DUF2786 domain-containing protein [Nocardia terpenica]|uniref:DUF2786 domain-containing protein n=1 Tax=Nocardia terpenica TaxID=455432 RepID=A0A164H2Q6_9NOCA|nr:DUF2786 domain-containing protein [Nocardia terpenica]KZM68148.1 hypothetical protein AWN90_09410 [Nocardia terpenica]NQE88994.1 DUF2786 domain-containing protein [Nocardia terpenica]